MLKIVLVFGTRPGAIKMAPIIGIMAHYPDCIRPVVCITAQHREMLDQVLRVFKIEPDYDLQLMKNNQTLSEITHNILKAMDELLVKIQPDWLLVQGDSTTAMASSLAAYYHQIKIGHVEAGLRTYQKYAPFPEEINRRIISLVADLHFAPTERSRQALLREGISESAIRLTGNTVIDALLWTLEIVRRDPPALPERLQTALAEKCLLLVTGHRRESFGEPLRHMCLALRDIAIAHPDLAIVYPVHLNPCVQQPVFELLSNVKNVYLIDPLPYTSFVWLMDRASLILTDSGGVQEEAVALGKHVLVMRDTTERMEGIATDLAFLAGREREQIAHQVHRFLDNAHHLHTAEPGRINTTYGDGQASSRIVEAILSHEQ